jgi:hypothetical protein
MNIKQKIDSYLEEASGKKKYMVLVGGGVGELYSADEYGDPKSALTAWVDGQKKSPMDVSIHAGVTDAQKLIDWVLKNEDAARKILSRQRVYKVDYLIDEVRKNPRVATFKRSNFRDYNWEIEFDKDRESRLGRMGKKPFPQDMGVTKKDLLGGPKTLIVSPFEGG